MISMITYNLAKGTIWNILGLIVKRFPHEDEKLAEIQKSLLYNLKEQFDSKKPGELLDQIENINYLSFTDI